MFARVENGVTKVSPKKQQASTFWTPETAVFSGDFSFFGRGRINFLWGGGAGTLDVSLQNWLASDHPEAYTSMSRPLFGVKDVCYAEKKVGTKYTFFLARQACMQVVCNRTIFYFVPLFLLLLLRTKVWGL